MTVNIRIVDAQLGVKDLDDEYVTDAWLIDQHVGNVLFSWGSNDNGSLGLGDLNGRSSPVQVGSMVNWRQVAPTYYHTAAIKNDGTLWTWGSNGFNLGALGQNNLTDRSSPVQVGALSNWKQVATNQSYNLAIKTDGTLWAWGDNNYGQLGTGTTTVTYSSPVQIGSLTIWKQVSCGYLSTTAITADGKLWAWGRNDSGQLGLGDLNSRSSPVQVGTLTTWKTVGTGHSHHAGITTDGKLYAWGENTFFGGLGLNDRVDRSTPVQVGSLTDWRQVSCGYNYTAAIKTDGTLWSWGEGGSGNLGLGNSASYSSPVQVGSLTNWKYINCGYSFTTAIKTDGTLWSWGYNGDGSLGLGDLTNRSSPVQVGSLTNWKTVAGNTLSILAITYREI